MKINVNEIPFIETESLTDSEILMLKVSFEAGIRFGRDQMYDDYKLYKHYYETPTEFYNEFDNDEIEWVTNENTNQR